MKYSTFFLPHVRKFGAVSLIIKIVEKISAYYSKLQCYKHFILFKTSTQLSFNAAVKEKWKCVEVSKTRMQV